MSKTTIDGLAVRAQKKQRPVVHASRGTVDFAKPRKSTTRSAAKKAPAEKIDSTKEFLEPVESFGGVSDEPAKAKKAKRTKNTGADWSELLETLQTTNDDKPVAAETSAAGSFAEPTKAWSGEWGQSNLQDDEVDEDDDAYTEDLEDEDEDEDYDKNLFELPRPKKRSIRRRKRVSVGKVVAICLVCLVVGAAGLVYFWGDSLISRLTGGKSGFWDTLSAMISDEIPFETDQNGRTNVLVFGTGGYNMDGETSYGEHDGSQLTDSIMVVSVDQETQDVALLSIPRDLKVSMACSAGKINEVYWCNNRSGNNEDAGARALMKQLGEVLGIEFQYYAHVNWASLISIVDTLGGITVTLDEDINDVGWTEAVAHAGETIEVNGEQALGLARARHGTSGGDFTRGNTQQKIVEGIAQKVVSQGLSMQEALNILNILGDNLRSNFSSDNIKAGIRLIANFDTQKIRQVPLVDHAANIYYMTTDIINNISYVVPAAGVNNYKDIQNYVLQMFSSNPVTQEGAEIMVYNATNEYGVAGAERTRLEGAGFIVAGVGDADNELCIERYCVYALNEDNQRTNSALAEFYGIEVLPVEQAPDELIRKNVDFLVLVGSPENQEA